MIRNASSSTGSADITSTKRMMTKSVLPPRQPASAPMGTPIIRASSWEKMAMLNEMRAP